MKSVNGIRDAFFAQKNARAAFFWLIVKLSILYLEDRHGKR